MGLRQTGCMVLMQQMSACCHMLSRCALGSSLHACFFPNLELRIICHVDALASFSYLLC